MRPSYGRAASGRVTDVTSALMDRDELRAIQAPLKERYCVVLQTLLVTPRVETSVG